jgi:hypothetical protein
MPDQSESSSMSGFRHSEDRVDLVVLVDLRRGTYLPPGVSRVPPTLKGTPVGVDAPDGETVLRLAGCGSCHLLASVARCSAEEERGSPRAFCGSEDPAFLKVSLVAGLNVLREAGIVSMLVDERSHQGAACPTPALCWA